MPKRYDYKLSQYATASVVYTKRMGGVYMPFGVESTFHYFTAFAASKIWRQTEKKKGTYNLSERRVNYYGALL